MVTTDASIAATRATSLADGEDESTIPFPEFDPSIVGEPTCDICDLSNMGRGSPARPADPDLFDPFASGKGYPEFPPDCTNVVRGFPVHNDTLPPPPMPVRCFPPPSNAAYDRALHAHLVKRWEGEEGDAEAERERGLRMQRLKIRVVPQDGYFTEVRHEVDRGENQRPGGSSEDGGGKRGLSLGLGIEGILRERQEGQDKDGDSGDDGFFMRRDVSRGERLARNIDFRRDPWITTAPGVSGDILPASEQRADFVADINAHGEQLELCTVCMTAHIPPGPPITLADRDTCGSYLPRWFPAHLVARPWDTYRRLINELVALDEKTQEQRERAQDPARPRWDLEWHEADAGWVAAGRREGWWKCRAGPDAPPVERACRVCHRARGPGERAPTVGEEAGMREERKRVLQGFIDRQVRVFGEMDREIALARMQLEGMGLMERGEGGRERRAEGGERRAEEEAREQDTEAMTRAVEEILQPSSQEESESGESGAKLTPDSTTASIPFPEVERHWN